MSSKSLCRDLCPSHCPAQDAASCHPAATAASCGDSLRHFGSAGPPCAPSHNLARSPCRHGSVNSFCDSGFSAASARPYILSDRCSRLRVHPVLSFRIPPCAILPGQRSGSLI